MFIIILVFHCFTDTLIFSNERSMLTNCWLKYIIEIVNSIKTDNDVDKQATDVHRKTDKDTDAARNTLF